MEADVIVIGGGMAGTVAALRAASLGADVLLIRKGHGSSAMSSGTVDVAGPERFLPLDGWDSLPTIGDRLGEIIRANPLHPYSVIAGGRDGIDRLRSGLRQACDFMIEQIPSIRFRGSHERNLALPSVLGTVKFCAFAPASLAGGDLIDMRDSHLLLVGMTGFPHFRPRLCKQAMERYSSLHPPEAISRIDCIEADIPRLTDGHPRNPFEVAQHFDDPRVSEEFAKELGKQIQPGVTHVVLPPVLGSNNHVEAHETLSRELEPEVVELISPNFSVPGHRLQLSLEAALRLGSVRVVTAEVTGVECDGRLVRNLLLGGMKSKRTAAAKNYVVASGKFSSGGLVADDSPKEPLFKLPLFLDGECVDGKFVQNLLDWKVLRRQPLLSCGIRLNASLRPLDTFGEPAYENLYAAGSIIGEYDCVADKCGFGVAILTGYLAGEKAAG